MSFSNTDPGVQDVLSKSSAAIESLLQAAVEQEKTIESLKAANAELQRKHVILEKVASTPQVDTAGVDKVVDELVSSGYLSDSEGVKFAAELKKSPSGLLKLASTLIRINNPSHEGLGVPRTDSVKQASTIAEEWKLDGWDACF